MQTRHVLITLLVIAHVMVGLVAWSLGDLPEYGDRLLLAVIATGQVNLLAVWTALGGRVAPWRLAVLVSAIVGWSWIEASVTGDDPHWIALLLSPAAILVVVLCAARFYGLRLYNNDDKSIDSKDNGPWQFTLARLFAWTTSFAICLGLLSLTFRSCSDWNTGNLWELPIITIGSTAVVLICCLSMISRGFFYLGFAALLVGLVFLGIVFPPIFFGFVHSGMRFFILLQIPVVGASLLVCQVSGYRLHWKRNQG